MQSDKEPIYISDVIARLRWTKAGFIFVLATTIVSVIFLGIIKAISDLFTIPYNRRSRIKNWLRTEPNLIEDFELEKGNWGRFTFQIQLRHGPEMTVDTISRQVIRLYAIHEIGPGPVYTIADREEIRNELQPMLEAVLSNMRGHFSYLDADGEPCTIENMEAIGIAYRFYTDGFSQQEFMNALLDIERAVQFVDQRIAQMGDNLKDGA